MKFKSADELANHVKKVIFFYIINMISFALTVNTLI